MGILKNARHERFAQDVACGKTLDESYRNAGFRPSRSNAARLSANEAIADRIAELKSLAADMALDRAAVSKEWVMRELRLTYLRATASGQGAVANRSLELLGKEAGMFVDRREVGRPGDFADLSDDQLNDEIARLSAAVETVHDADERGRGAAAGVAGEAAASLGGTGQAPKPGKLH